ncbi:hypothetical protein TraAM80_01932 [Trypanosoma rangeli]|uniref:DUF4042 domain-containing protein n=1 Tax=Trypanosoma rangeli TaxID=5698 RepID=A0A3R7NQ20_TRYRA|nr:uncharacterized protein TraAM80_01932 [Trypanosoma rangeli]RNF09798.1 hypothetical protein TraAM80_01932 [Trypanosoma rangeli]|eukprot:RNF09798.1 hypothetical protein TraAM80_01932 [Trypanosoma rangeli]
MQHMSLRETEGTVRGVLETFSDALARDAQALVYGCGEVVQMPAEASAIMQRQPPSEPTAATAAEASASAWSWEKIPRPTPLLYFAAVSKLNSLQHSTKVQATGDERNERAMAERVLLLLRVICIYCFATARPVTGPSGDVPSQGSSGRTTPLTRPARRPDPANNHPNTESENPDVETRMAEETFRVAVDAVVRFSIYGAARCGKGGTVSLKDSAKPVELCTEVSIAALCLLTAALMRFRNAPFNAMRYLPALFPEIDARDSRVTHPLFTPLLWSPEERVRAAAAALVSSLLHKLQHNFKYAEEPQQKRKSFSSLASQSGRALASLHDVLLYSLQLPNVSPATAGAATHFSKGLVFSTFAVLVATTPYRRCPHALEVVQQALELPLVRDALLDASCEEFAAAATFLSSVFKAESLTSVVSSYLANEGGEASATSKVPRDPPLEWRVGGGALLLKALLTHAASRVEVWRCVVQLSRIHPWIVGTHFAILMDAACAVLGATLQKMEEEKENTAANGNVAVGNTLGECLRAWLHFMGYVWQSFDGHSADPALREDYVAYRATQLQKQQILTELVLPALQMTSNGGRYTEAWRTALRCVAQVGDDYFSAMPRTRREAIVAQVIGSTTAHESSVRSEAFTTIGVWAWQYSAFEEWLTGFVERAASALCNDAEPTVRFKAAFALSNITSRLREETELSPLRQSPHHMQLLCDVAMYATQVCDDPAVVGHGIRMMSHLLHSLSFEELIAELPEEQECVAEGYLNALLRFLLPSNRDAKLRWNTACALGLGLSREVVFEAEPPAATRAVERLCVIVCHDRIFKVRTQAAVALAKVPMTCLSAGRYTAEDLAPKVTRALCEALQASGGSTENFAQYKEQDALCAALRQALGVMITSASPSAMLQRVFGEYRVMLEAEGLL